MTLFNVESCRDAIPLSTTYYLLSTNRDLRPTTYDIPVSSSPPMPQSNEA
jgi:hypothetical protein